MAERRKRSSCSSRAGSRPAPPRGAWPFFSARNPADGSATACASTTSVGRDTVIEVVTEGVFARMIIDDPELSGIAAVLFDEFHERSLDADFGLALALDAQGALRDDLRLLVMSATLDVQRIAALLDIVLRVMQSVMPEFVGDVEGPILGAKSRRDENSRAVGIVEASVLSSSASPAGSTMTLTPLAFSAAARRSSARNRPV